MRCLIITLHTSKMNNLLPSMRRYYNELFKVPFDMKETSRILSEDHADVIVVEIISFLYVQRGCEYYGCRNTFYVNTELSRELCDNHLYNHIRRIYNIDIFSIEKY